MWWDPTIIQIGRRKPVFTSNTNLQRPDGVLLSVGRPSFLLNCLASVRNYDGMILSN